MIKRVFISFGMILLLSFTSCGGSSSEEAKQLLTKILQLVGIPQTMVANICQDNNRNGICESLELQASIILNQGDTAEDILQKITESEDGRYFLETYDETKPILLVLNSTTVKYDGGVITLNFDGFESKEQNESKEISILQSMIDADHISENDVKAIRELDNKDAQDKFYATLLEDLETNINTLRDKGLDAQGAMSANVKEIAEELLAFGVEDTLPKKLNVCNGDSACIDEVLNSLSIELLITNAEAEEIKKSQEAIATTDNSNQNKIDMAKYYFPSSSITKEYITSTTRDGQESQTSSHSEIFTVNDNVITQKNSNGGTQTTTIKEDTIVSIQPNDKLITYSRYSQVGDVLYTIPLDSTINDQIGGTAVTTGEMVCTLGETINEFSNKDYIYTGDILKINCIINSKTELTSSINSDFLSTTTTKGTTIQYVQKGIALITSIGDSCSEGNFIPKTCTHTETNYLK